MKANLYWTPEKDASLIAAAKAGVSLQRLAARFGRSNAGIRHRLMELGLRAAPAKRLPKAQM
jgi:hypothetical protein